MASHVGPLSSLLPTTPGFAFLVVFLPKLDSLAPVDLSPHLAPDARFIVNGGPAVGGEQLQAMFAMRAKMVAFFRHDITRAWDVPAAAAAAAEGGGGKQAGPSSSRRTVMFEGSSTTVFHDDDNDDDGKDAKEVTVSEFGVVDLVIGDDGEWKLKELRSVVDMGPMAARRAKMAQGGQS